MHCLFYFDTFYTILRLVLLLRCSPLKCIICFNDVTCLSPFKNMWLFWTIWSSIVPLISFAHFVSLLFSPPFIDLDIYFTLRRLIPAVCVVFVHHLTTCFFSVKGYCVVILIFKPPRTRSPQKLGGLRSGSKVAEKDKACFFFFFSKSRLTSWLKIEMSLE